MAEVLISKLFVLTVKMNDSKQVTRKSVLKAMNDVNAKLQLKMSVER